MSGFVLDPHEGPAYQFHGATVVIKASGEHTLGQLGHTDHVGRALGEVRRRPVHHGEAV